MKTKDEEFDRILKEVIDFMKKSDKVFKELAMSTSKITSFEKETAKIVTAKIKGTRKLH